MSDRPTPETDTAQHEGLLRGNPTPTLVVLASFARRLERQRDAAIERFESSQEARATLKRELDEAREQIAKANSERENDTQAELAAWELLRDTRELARDLRDALENIVSVATEFYDMDMGDNGSAAIEQSNAALDKAKEALP